jgi:hypothetical protein
VQKPDATGIRQSLQRNKLVATVNNTKAAESAVSRSHLQIVGANRVLLEAECIGARPVLLVALDLNYRLDNSG